MSQPLTPWYPPRKKPLRIGIYETRYRLSVREDHRVGYSFWDGVYWGNQQPTIDRVQLDDLIGWQNKEWRGLAKPPK